MNVGAHLFMLTLVDVLFTVLLPAKFALRTCPQTPLYELCINDEQPSISLMELLAISKTVVEVKDRLGRTSLHCMSLNGHVTREALAILVNKSPGILLMKDYNGQIPLHIASTLSNETARCLLEAHPSGVRTVDKNGKTPLVLACEKNADLSVIYQLVSVDPVVVLGLDSHATRNDARKCQRVA